MKEKNDSTLPTVVTVLLVLVYIPAAVTGLLLGWQIAWWLSIGILAISLLSAGVGVLTGNGRLRVFRSYEDLVMPIWIGCAFAAVIQLVQTASVNSGKDMSRLADWTVGLGMITYAGAYLLARAITASHCPPPPQPCPENAEQAG